MLKSTFPKIIFNSLKKKKIYFWAPGFKINQVFVTKKLIIPKGLFYRVVMIKKEQIGLISGMLTSNRKPFVKPVKTLRR